MAVPRYTEGFDLVLRRVMSSGSVTISWVLRAINWNFCSGVNEEEFLVM